MPPGKRFTATTGRTYAGRRVAEKWRLGAEKKFQIDALKLQLAKLPFELLARLKEGVELRAMEMIDGAIAEIHTHNASLGDALTRLVDDFQSVQLLTLLQEVGFNK